MRNDEFQFDEIGYWSEIKLEILKNYAAEYSKILSAQKNPSFYHIYIDAFAGAGVHQARASGDFVPGSPMNALNVRPPFNEYHLIDIAPKKVESLRKLIGSREDVFIYEGDCNQILLEKVFPRVRYEEYKRGVMHPRPLRTSSRLGRNSSSRPNEVLGYVLKLPSC